MTSLEGTLSLELPYGDTSSVIVGNETHLPIHHAGQMSFESLVMLVKSP